MFMPETITQTWLGFAMGSLHSEFPVVGASTASTCVYDRHAKE